MDKAVRETVMKTVWSGVVGIAVLAGVVYMSRMSTDQVDQAAADPPLDVPALASEPSADPAVDTNAEASAESPFEVVDDPPQTLASDTAPESLEATIQPVDTNESVGQGSLAPLPEVPLDAREQAVDEVPALDAANDESLLPDAQLEAPGLSAPVDVPESYPVTDAERYFLPPEERRPGNLGGPPPLNFPGGPSDPNRPDATLAPPVAPGQ